MTRTLTRWRPRAAALALGAMVAATTIGGPSSPVAAAEAPDATTLMKDAHLNLYYAREDGKARVEMNLTDKRGKTRTRTFLMYRLDEEDGGAQKYFTYFLEPSDVRRTSFMVWKNPDDQDDRWIYIPSVDLVRRISAKDKGSSFVGSDFSYEDVSGRHWSDDTHTLLREEELEGHRAYVIESVPKEEDAFSRKLTWVDAERRLPLREEYYDDKDRLERVFEAVEIVEIDGVQTVTHRRMTNVRKEHVTDVIFGDVAYDVGVEASLFTERYLKAPPRGLLEG